MAWLKFKCEKCGNEYKFEAYHTNDPSYKKEYWRKLQGEPYGLCPDCYQAKKKAELEEKNRQAMLKAKEMGLPELTGTEKQVAWANSIRQKHIDMLEDEIETLQEDLENGFDFVEEDIETYKKALKIIRTKTEAKWFINTRTLGTYSLAERLVKGEIE